MLLGNRFPRKQKRFKLKSLEGNDSLQDALRSRYGRQLRKSSEEIGAMFRKEIKASTKECEKHKAILKVIFENDFFLR